MSKRSYTRQPIKPTALGQKVLRIRLSLGETQTQFAQRFRVSKIAIYKWESGRIRKVHPMNELILNTIYSALEAENRLMPIDIFKHIYSSELELHGSDTFRKYNH